MSGDSVLVLSWLVLAHLAADFLLQTSSMVADKFTPGRRAWRGLAVHGGAVALCLTPAVAAYGARGLGLLAVVAISHVLIDRWKVRATRHAEAQALASAHRVRARDGAGEGDGEGLGPAWTPVPGALFLVDQLLHLAVTLLAFLAFLAPVQPIAQWTSLVNRVVAGVDPAALHAWALTSVVVASLVIVNVRGAALFVATLVRPRESVTGVALGDPAPGPAAPRLPQAWRVRVGPFEGTAEPIAGDPPLARPRADAGNAPPARIGATIGILERLLIVTFVLSNATAAIGFVIAAKTLARFKQLDDRDFAEYYLLGTLASVGVALGSAMLAQAALASLG